MSAGPLPGWRETPAKQPIVEFVAAVTGPGSPDFVPERDRIAVFDNDGALWALTHAGVTTHEFGAACRSWRLRGGPAQGRLRGHRWGRWCGDRRRPHRGRVGDDRAHVAGRVRRRGRHCRIYPDHDAEGGRHPPPGSCSEARHRRLGAVGRRPRGLRVRSSPVEYLGWVKPKNSPITIFGFSLTLFVLAAGGILLWGFVTWQRHREATNRDPLVHLSLARIPPVRSGLIGMFSQNLLLMGIFFVVPLYLQLVLGLSALETGIKMLPISITMFATAAILGSSLGVALIGSIVLIGLTSTFISNVEHDPRISADVSAQVGVAAGSNTNFVSATQLDAAAKRAGLDATTTAALVDDYEAARLRSLKAGLLAAAFLALISLGFTRELPHERPTPRTDRAPAAVSS